jgi:peptide/nickel transport system permease protein
MSAVDEAAPTASAPTTRRWRLGDLRGIPVVLIVLLTVIVIGAAAADFIATHPPDQASLRMRLKPPFWIAGGSLSYPLGTDGLGRDIFSRILYGARISLAVGLLAVAGGGALGITLGMVSGYFGGKIDAIVMRLTDAASAIPIVLVALLFVVTLGASFVNVIIALAALLWARYARVVRSEVLSLRERDFVTLARIADASHFWILTRHILPNLLNTVVVMLTLQVGVVILTEATLSFLGAGVPPPMPAWGSMVADGRDYIATAWWISFFPGMAILITVLTFNLFGDWLRDRLDPKLRQL